MNENSSNFSLFIKAGNRQIKFSQGAKDNPLYHLTVKTKRGRFKTVTVRFALDLEDNALSYVSFSILSDLGYLSKHIQIIKTENFSFSNPNVSFLIYSPPSINLRPNPNESSSILDLFEEAFSKSAGFNWKLVSTRGALEKWTTKFKRTLKKNQFCVLDDKQHHSAHPIQSK